VPIDRLTDVHGPLDCVARRVSRHQLAAALYITTSRPQPHEPQDRPPTSAELVRAFAVARGWLNGSGAPDETRAGRALLKDYTAGKVVYCVWPPGHARRCPYDDGLGTFTGHPELLRFASGACRLALADVP
jgi:large subunit GTPase 1